MVLEAERQSKARCLPEECHCHLEAQGGWGTCPTTGDTAPAGTGGAGVIGPAVQAAGLSAPGGVTGGQAGRSVFMSRFSLVLNCWAACDRCAPPVPLAVVEARRWGYVSLQGVFICPLWGSGQTAGRRPPDAPLCQPGPLTTVFSCLVPPPNTPPGPHPSCPVLPGGPSLAHRESSWQPAFQGAQRCRGHLCCGLAQPDGRAGACPSKCPHQPLTCPCLWGCSMEEEPRGGGTGRTGPPWD